MSTSRPSASLLWLSVGRIGSRAASLAVQTTAAVFLAPEGLGAWATASSIQALLHSLKNRGIANAFLRSATPIGNWRQRLRRWNLGIAFASLGVPVVAAAVGFLDSQELAIALVLAPLVLVISEAEWRELALMKLRLERPIAGAYWKAASVQVILGVGLASAFGTPWALLAATWGWAASLAVALPACGKPGRQAAREPKELAAVRWSGPVLVLGGALASKADYVVGAALLSRADLGRYFLAYQASVGLSSLAAVPMGRLFILHGDQEGSNRAALLRAVGWMAVATPVAGAVGLAAGLLLPIVAGSEWQNPWLFLILFASTPARLVGELVVASDQRALDWGRSARDKWVDAAGTVGFATAGLMAFGRTEVVLAVAVVLWKTSFAGVRVLIRLRSGQEPMRESS